MKLSGDAAMQIDIDDDRRGQVFALQDTVFNVAFIGAIAAASTVIAPDGKSVRPGRCRCGCLCRRIVSGADQPQETRNQPYWVAHHFSSSASGLVTLERAAIQT